MSYLVSNLHCPGALTLHRMENAESRRFLVRYFSRLCGLCRGKCRARKLGGDHFLLLLWRNDLCHVFGTEYVHVCVIPKSIFAKAVFI